ncbi:hypothetical protein D3C80_1532150 [compost metagenome]
MGIIQPGSGDVIHFDQIDAPLGIQLKEGIIIFLRTFFGCVYSVHIRVPGADGVGMGNLACCRRCTEQCRSCVCSLPRNAAHNMNAELQPQAVYVISKRLEALASSCRREAVLGRHQP